MAYYTVRIPYFSYLDVFVEINNSKCSFAHIRFEWSLQTLNLFSIVRFYFFIVLTIIMVKKIRFCDTYENCLELRVISYPLKHKGNVSRSILMFHFEKTISMQYLPKHVNNNSLVLFFLFLLFSAIIEYNRYILFST